jgi:chemotaxis protein CheD
LIVSAGAFEIDAGKSRSTAAIGAAGRRFYDNTSGTWMVKVYPGDYYVTSKPDEMLVTVLGSCVAACIRDPKTGAGGMNHFMLPEGDGTGWGGDMMSMRFGNHAMEKLINEIIKLGCPRERMEIKVFGGGNVIESSQAVGTKNAEFVMRYLRDEGLKCVAQDLGGDFPRRIQYMPSTGKVVRRILGRNDAEPIVREEKMYAGTLRAPQKASGDVELFGDFK